MESVLRVPIHSDLFSASDALGILERDASGDSAEISYEITQPEMKVRGTDLSIIVALVGAGGTAIGALLSGLLTLAKEAGGNRITLQSKSGSRIEIKATASREEVREAAMLMREFELHSCVIDDVED